MSHGDDAEVDDLEGAVRRIMTGQVWDDFCDRLKAAGALVRARRPGRLVPLDRQCLQGFVCPGLGDSACLDDHAAEVVAEVGGECGMLCGSFRSPTRR